VGSTVGGAGPGQATLNLFEFHHTAPPLSKPALEFCSWTSVLPSSSIIWPGPTHPSDETAA
jgi:hypothetical protein